MESTGFMNALASATVATQPRKRKRTTATKVERNTDICCSVVRNK